MPHRVSHPEQARCQKNDALVRGNPHPHLCRIVPPWVHLPVTKNGKSWQKRGDRLSSTVYEEKWSGIRDNSCIRLLQGFWHLSCHLAGWRTNWVDLASRLQCTVKISILRLEPRPWPGGSCSGFRPTGVLEGATGLPVGLHKTSGGTRRRTGHHCLSYYTAGRIQDGYLGVDSRQRGLSLIDKKEPSMERRSYIRAASRLAYVTYSSYL